MGYTQNIPPLKVGYNPFTNNLLTSWDIQVLMMQVKLYDLGDQDLCENIQQLESQVPHF